MGEESGASREAPLNRREPSRSCVTLILPLCPDRGNSRRHWGLQRRMEAAWALKAMAWLHNAGMRPPTKPYERFTLHVTVVTKRKSDLDNCTARLKVAIDYLRKKGWLLEDGPDYMTSLTVVNKVDTKWPRIEVHIDEVPRTGVEPA